MSKNRKPTPIAAGVTPWPDKVVGNYYARGWWLGRPLGALLLDSADAHAGSIAIVDGTKQVTYASLAARADALASRLVDDLGLEAGDRIVVQLPNCWQFVVLTLACLRSGIVPIMALPAHREHELSYIIEQSEAAALVVPDQLRGFDHAAMADKLCAASPYLERVMVVGAIGPEQVDLTELCTDPPEPSSHRRRWDATEPDSRAVAVFLLSGGTTGLPKLIARTHDDYAYNASASAQLCRFGPGTRYLVSLPISHNFPLACPGVLGTLLTGGRVVMSSSPQPASSFALIDTESITATAVVPAVAQRWLNHAAEVGGDQTRTLELLQVGGSRIADEQARRVRPVLGATLQQVFGMAEGLLNYTRLDDPEDIICSTQGRPLSNGDEVRLVDDNDIDVPSGQPGSLLTRGPYTPRGYYNAPEQNTRAFTPDGWYRSGDVVRRRPDGNLIVEGRDKDMINRGGENISAEEVENLTYALAAVTHAAAVAMPDPDLGERVCLYAILKPGKPLTLEELRESFAAAGVAKYKWPERLETVNELPLTSVGKVDKKALRHDIARRLGGH
jgi:2,3-dihydroxybenzoate-AMP ligase